MSLLQPQLFVLRTAAQLSPAEPGSLMPLVPLAAPLIQIAHWLVPSRLSVMAAPPPPDTIMMAIPADNKLVAINIRQIIKLALVAGVAPHQDHITPAVPVAQPVLVTITILPQPEESRVVVPLIFIILTAASVGIRLIRQTAGAVCAAETAAWFNLGFGQPSVVIAVILNGGGKMYGLTEQLPAQAVGIATPAVLISIRIAMMIIALIITPGATATSMARC